MNIISTHNRIVYIDNLKVFAIFLVVLGHICMNYGKNNEIAIYHYGILPYHMPLFAIISGLFFNAQINFKSFVSKKFIQIALPFLLWCFIVAVVIRGIDETYRHFTEGFTIHFKSWGECLFMFVVDWGWWFLRDLFVSFIYAYIAIQLLGRNVLIGVFLSVVLLYMLSLSGIFPNKWNKEFVFLYPFFCSGILLKEYKHFIFSKEKTVLLVSSLTFIVCMLFWQGHDDTFYSMNTSMLEQEGHAGITGWMVPVKIVYRFITGLSASVMLILLARRYERHLPTHPFVMSIGRNTLGIYILHDFAFQIFAPPSSHILFENRAVSLVVCLAISVVLVIVCDGIVELTSRNQWLALLLWGKQKKKETKEYVKNVFNQSVL